MGGLFVLVLRRFGKGGQAAHGTQDGTLGFP